LKDSIVLYLGLFKKVHDWSLQVCHDSGLQQISHQPPPSHQFQNAPSEIFDRAPGVNICEI